ncbi:MAG: 3-oxoacyl-ACP reductase family protein [Kofleriaceae bacterium]
MASPSDGKLLAGRCAFVTGSTRGIGWEIARTLAAHGASVALNGRDADAVEARAHELTKEHGGQALALPGDVADAAAVTRCYQTVFKTWKRLDVLVNNAGILEDALLGMITPELVDRVLGVNTKGAILHLQGAARLMTRAKAGSIINLSSIIGTMGNEGQAVYGASKAALLGLTRSAAKELAPVGIRVNAIAPGYIETDMIKHLPAEVHALRLSQIGMGRIGTPADIANVALFLASDLSAYVTGQVLGVDGGMRI